MSDTFTSKETTELRELEAFTETRCGVTKYEVRTGMSFFNPKREEEYELLLRCDREPGHDGPHYGPRVETDWSWEAWGDDEP